MVDRPTCIHALGAIKRPDGRVRCITDCSRPDTSINDYMDTTAKKFVFSKVDDAVAVSSQDGTGAVIDISSAYRSICIHPSNRQFCGFVWDFGLGQGEQYFQDNVMCFGIRSACYIFNSVTDFVRRHLQHLGVTVINYLDDFYIPGDNFSVGQENQVLLIRTLRHMGFGINWSKATSPSPIVKYLGIEIDLVSQELRLPADKLLKAKQDVQSLVGKTWCSKRS